ncbi:MAG: hypothetical protein WC028_06420 [Candidatus Obscuribacterales bacterium]
MVAALIAFVAFHPAVDLFAGLNPYLVSMTTELWGHLPIDNRKAIFAHKIFFACLVGLALIWPLFSAYFKTKFVAFDRNKIDWCLGLVSIAFLAWSGLNFNGYPQQLTVGLFLAAVLAAFTWARLPGDRLLATALVFALALLAIVPGFFQVTDFSNRSTIEVLQIQQHYAMCVGFSDKLVYEVPLVPATLLYYGVLIPTALGAFQRLAGVLSFGDLTHFVQLTQLLLLLAVGFLLLKLARRCKEIALLAFLTVLPWFHFAQVGLSYPNQSGWRYLGIFCLLIAMLGMRKFGGRKLAFSLGAGAGFCLLFNVETGVTVVIATALALFLLRSRLSDFKTLAWLIGPVIYIGGFLAAVAAYALLFLLLFGYLPPFINPAKISVYVKAAEAISMTGTILPIAILIFLHSAFVFARVATISAPLLTIRHAIRGVVAVLIIVWEMYYFNRPFFANLAGVAALYALLLVDSLRFVRIAILRRNLYISRARNREAIILLGALAVIVAPTALLSWTEAGKTYVLQPNSAKETPTCLVSQVLLPKALGEYVLDKSAYLKSFNGKETFRYVSIYSLLVPRLSQLEQPFPYTDPYFGINLLHDYENYIDLLLKSDATYILLDDQDSDPALRGQHWYSLYLCAMEKALFSRYEFLQCEHGWRVLQLRKGSI